MCGSSPSVRELHRENNHTISVLFLQYQEKGIRQLVLHKGKQWEGFVVTWLQHALCQGLSVEGVCGRVEQVAQDDGSIHDVPRWQNHRVSHQCVHQRVCYNKVTWFTGNAHMILPTKSKTTLTNTAFLRNIGFRSQAYLEDTNVLLILLIAVYIPRFKLHCK